MQLSDDQVLDVLQDLRDHTMSLSDLKETIDTIHEDFGDLELDFDDGAVYAVTEDEQRILLLTQWKAKHRLESKIKELE